VTGADGRSKVRTNKIDKRYYSLIWLGGSIKCHVETVCCGRRSKGRDTNTSATAIGVASRIDKILLVINIFLSSHSAAFASADNAWNRKCDNTNKQIINDETIKSSNFK